RSTVLPTGTEMPGEVQFDPTRVSHITPIVTGVAREARANLGDHVEAGAVLAVIDSQEHGQAKSDYLDKEQMYVIAKTDHDRIAAIHESTVKLLGLLSSEPPASEVESPTHDLRVGEAKGRILTAYAT